MLVPAGWPDGLTSVSWAFLALAGMFAVADWWAVSGGDSRRHLEYLAKPGVLAALIVVAVSLRTPLPGMRGWFVAALVFCLVGDVLLMLPGDREEAFGGGLAAFLVAHVLFLVGLAEGGARLDTTLLALAAFAAVAAVPALAVLRGVREQAGIPLAVAVVVYLFALLTMAAAAWSAGLNSGSSGVNIFLIVGGTLFVVSDTLLAVNRFVRRLPRADLLVHVTYHLAVAALVLSLAGSYSFVQLFTPPS